MPGSFCFIFSVQNLTAISTSRKWNHITFCPYICGNAFGSHKWSHCSMDQELPLFCGWKYSIVWIILHFVYPCICCWALCCFHILLLWVVLLRQQLCASLCLRISLSSLWDICPGVELQSHAIKFNLLRSTRVFSAVSYHFTFPPGNVGGFLFLNIFTYFSACIFPHFETISPSSPGAASGRVESCCGLDVYFVASGEEHALLALSSALSLRNVYSGPLPIFVPSCLSVVEL